jgi:hypothetical protein
MPKDKTMKGKIKRAIKRAKKAKKKPKTRTITKKIGQQQTQRVVLNLADTGKRGGFGIGSSAFPTIVQRDTSDIGAGLGNILTELREQKRAVLELQRTEKPPMFYQARTPMRTNMPTQTTFMKYDDQQGTFPVRSFEGRLQEEFEEDPITELQDPIEMEKEAVIESEVETPEISGEITSRRSYLTLKQARQLSTQELMSPENVNKSNAKKVLEERQQEQRDRLTMLRGAEKAFPKPKGGGSATGI